MHTQALDRLNVENDLRRAIEAQEFTLHYQPIVELATGNLVGFEALIRWQTPTHELKPPGEFIPVAEETGIIACLDSWALRTACFQLARWQSEFPELSHLTVSVNLSAQDLCEPNLLSGIDRMLGLSGLEGSCLTIEITESMLIDNIDSTISLLREIQDRSIKISIDDFGTGYSSLSYLHRLPINSLKVDHSFVNQIEAGQSNHQIAEIIISLGNQLNLNTIAEGIETPKQLELLKDLGYEFGQGYLFSKPVCDRAAEAFLQSQCLHAA